MIGNHHIMIDLETTGVSAGCCILSIGACTLDLSSSFYEKIDIHTCHERGLTNLYSTMAWWDKQTAEAREEAFSGTTPLIVALGKFSDWFQGLEGRDNKIWGNGADFDIPILKAAYEACNMKAPWKPFNGRCYRTMKNLYPAIIMRKFEGTKHNALADAENQASHLLSILKFHYDRT